MKTARPYEEGRVFRSESTALLHDPSFAHVLESYVYVRVCIFVRFVDAIWEGGDLGQQVPGNCDDVSYCIPTGIP